MTLCILRSRELLVWARQHPVPTRDSRARARSLLAMAALMGMMR